MVFYHVRLFKRLTKEMIKESEKGIGTKARDVSKAGIAMNKLMMKRVKIGSKVTKTEPKDRAALS